MIVVDSSAVIAILWHEVEATQFAEAIAASDRALIAAPNALELYMVCVGRTTIEVGDDAMRLLDKLNIQIAPFDSRLTTLARTAHLRFGKGRHKAALNFGDCMSYALAKSLDAPLLYKGGDFARTDIRPAA